MFLNKIFTELSDFLFGVFSKVFGEDLAKSMSITVEDLAKDTVGKLAIDAVTYAETTFEGQSGAAKRDEALTKLKADLTAEGKNWETLGSSLLNTLVELAVQYIRLQTK